MVNLIDLGTFTDDGNIQVVVEMPKGARIKAKYDPTIAAFCYVRP
jgi:inorganic pyrophosphatase